MDITKLNSMTMSHFELNFVQEINERVTQADVLTKRDISKIRSMLKFIYRQVMRLTSEKEPKPYGSLWNSTKQIGKKIKRH